MVHHKELMQGFSTATGIFIRMHHLIIRALNSRPAGPSAPSAPSCMTITTVTKPPAKSEHDDYYRHPMLLYDDYYRHMTLADDDYYRHMTLADDDYYRHMTLADDDDYRHINLGANSCTLNALTFAYVLFGAL